MTPLSPAAQAVYDAAWAAFWSTEAVAQNDTEVIAAAALRAAVDQVLPAEDAMPEDGELSLQRRCQRRRTRFKLLAIAAELDGGTP